MTDKKLTITISGPWNSGAPEAVELVRHELQKRGISVKLIEIEELQRTELTASLDRLNTLGFERGLTAEIRMVQEPRAKKADE